MAGTSVTEQNLIRCMRFGWKIRRLTMKKWCFTCRILYAFISIVLSNKCIASFQVNWYLIEKKSPNVTCSDISWQRTKCGIMLLSRNRGKIFILKENHADISGDAPDFSTVQRWAAEFKRRWKRLEDDTSTGLSETITTVKNIDRVNGLLGIDYICY